jgi:hypothetical protein
VRTGFAAVVLAGLVLTACGDPEPAGGALPPPSEVTSPPTTGARPPVTSVSTPPTSATPGTPDSVLPAAWGAREPIVDLIGLPLDEFSKAAGERGFGPVRVAWDNGEDQALDADLRVGRINVAVVDRGGAVVVVDARIESDPETGWSEPEATIVGVYDGVGFYPACGDEQLEYDGVVWYQVQEYEYPEIYDRAVNGNREQAPETVTVHGLAARVVAPGPGDDVGTLVVWSDGVAYFVSDSGDLHAWLVQEELTYNWVC